MTVNSRPGRIPGHARWCLHEKYERETAEQDDEQALVPPGLGACPCHRLSVTMVSRQQCRSPAEPRLGHPEPSRWSARSELLTKISFYLEGGRLLNGTVSLSTNLGLPQRLPDALRHREPLLAA